MFNALTLIVWVTDLFQSPPPHFGTNWLERSARLLVISPFESSLEALLYSSLPHNALISKGKSTSSSPSSSFLFSVFILPTSRRAFWEGLRLSYVWTCSKDGTLDFFRLRIPIRKIVFQIGVYSFREMRRIKDILMGKRIEGKTGTSHP